MIKISLFVPKDWFSNIPALVQIMAWCQISDKPLSEQMVVKSIDAYMHHSASMSQMFQYIIIVYRAYQ